MSALGVGTNPITQGIANQVLPTTHELHPSNQQTKSSPSQPNTQPTQAPTQNADDWFHEDFIRGEEEINQKIQEQDNITQDTIINIAEQQQILQEIENELNSIKDDLGIDDLGELDDKFRHTKSIAGDKIDKWIKKIAIAPIAEIGTDWVKKNVGKFKDYLKRKTGIGTKARQAGEKAIEKIESNLQKSVRQGAEEAEAEGGFEMEMIEATMDAFELYFSALDEEGGMYDSVRHRDWRERAENFMDEMLEDDEERGVFDDLFSGNWGDAFTKDAVNFAEGEFKDLITKPIQDLLSGEITDLLKDELKNGSKIFSYAYDAVTEIPILGDVVDTITTNFLDTAVDIGASFADIGEGVWDFINGNDVGADNQKMNKLRQLLYDYNSKQSKLDRLIESAENQHNDIQDEINNLEDEISVEEHDFIIDRRNANLASNLIRDNPQFRNMSETEIYNTIKSQYSTQEQGKSIARWIYRFENPNDPQVKAHFNLYQQGRQGYI